MTWSLWRRSRELAAQVLEQDEEARRRVLREVETEDPTLAAEVRRLLELDARAGDFLEAPHSGLLHVSGAEAREGKEAGDGPKVGDTVGPYRLVSVLGRGGSGTVFEALRDQPYEQRVALKISPLAGDGGEWKKRFVRERQILARLSHPGIARIFDGGSVDGMPYLVMESVEGSPIDRHCERARDGAGLGLRERLELFLQVCDAVSYAHRRLVVHRDLKPSNVLVGVDGRVKVLDFGIAKLLERTPGDEEITLSGEGAFTPGYASPEQWRRGEITTATDVYALGVILYRLLTGELPRRFDSLRPEAVEDGLRRPVPSVGGRRLSGGERPGRDLDALLGRALAVETPDRYPTVDRLADDVRRYLEGRPVAARRPSWAYRSLRYLQRHRIGAAAALVILALAAGLVAHLVRSSRQLAHERDRAQRSSDFLVELLRSADPTRNGGERLTVAALLETAAEKARTELAPHPEERAGLLHTLGSIEYSQGDVVQAERLLDEALEERRRLLGPRHLGVAETLFLRGKARMARGAYGMAEEDLRTALAIRRERLGSRDPAVGEVIRDLATLQLQGGRFDRARILSEEALEIRRANFGPKHPAVADSLCSLAMAHHLLGRLVEAETLFRQALALEEAALGTDSLEAANTRLLLVRPLLVMRSDSPELDRLLDRAEAVFSRAFDDGHPRRLALETLRGRLFLARGDPGTAGRLLRAARAKATQGPSADAATAFYLGQALVRTGHTDEAEELFRHSERIAAGLPSGHPWRARPLHELAEVALERGDLGGALELAEQALAIQSAALPAGHYFEGEAEVLLGRILAAAGRPAAARPRFRRGAEILTKSLGADHPRALRARDLAEQGAVYSSPAPASHSSKSRR